MKKASAKVGEVKRLVQKLKEARGHLQGLVQEYAERQGAEAKKLVEGDLERLRDFVSRERRELERFQKQIPAELERWKKYLAGQRQELEKVMAGMVGGAKKPRSSRSAGKGAKKGVRKAKKKTVSAASGATGAVSQD